MQRYRIGTSYGMLDVGCWMSEVGSRKLEVGSWKLEVGSWKLLDQCKKIFILNLKRIIFSPNPETIS